MGLVKPDVGRFARIKVIGVGGGGSNAIASMFGGNTMHGVDFVVVNTDAQALLSNPAPNKLQIGENLTRGLGAGGDPEIGRQAAEESREKIKEYLMDADMVFLTYGAGGGTGTGAGPIVAEIAKEIGALTVAIITKPFAFEGAQRMVNAEDGLDELKSKVDALIIIPNQRILDVVDRKMTLIEAFRVVDSVLAQGVQGISDIITVPGLINVDFADVKTIMKSAGSALMGMGTGVGENRAQMAARLAISSPLLDTSIEGAKGILINITGGPDLTMSEVDEAASTVSQAADADANIIFGATLDEKMVDQIKITVIATGFDQSRAQLSRLVGSTRSQAPSFQNPIVPRQQHDTATSGVITENPSVEPQVKPEVTPSPEPNQPEDSDREFDIPAFLRQGR